VEVYVGSCFVMSLGTIINRDRGAVRGAEWAKIEVL
jgi:hypothetical protein